MTSTSPSTSPAGPAGPAGTRYRLARPAIAPPAPHRKKIAIFIAATAATAVATLVLGMWLGGNLSPSTINGLAIGGNGSLTDWGLPASKLVMDLSSVGVLGMLVVCLLLPARDPGADVSAVTQRLLRTAAWLALTWAISNAVLLLFSWSNVIARPVTALPITNLFTDATGAFPAAADYISSTALALVIAAGIAITKTRAGAWLLLPLAAYNLTPMALQGHAAHGTLLKYSLITHVIAISLWVGGLTALTAYVRKEPALIAVAAPRFSTLALACYIAVAVSGILAAWKLLGTIPAIWGSRYGVLVMLKAAALITLGIFGWWHRRHTIHRIRGDNGPRARRAFIRLAAAEIAIMVAAVAIAVALSRSASPDTIVLHSGRQASAPAHYAQPATHT